MDVAGQLQLPIGRVLLGCIAMQGTAMPEAPVNEHGNARASEHDVWARLDSVQHDPEVLTEAPTADMQRRSQCKLGLGVRATDRSHDARAARRCRGRRRWYSYPWFVHSLRVLRT
ncbi:hypothetical protein NOCARDAX2BIS_220172 [Nocardioides sp. AX2bis]|nr:hypothetical protein NOCARDAX2BIS_220172 [Nocardioides sp. AX2bis]